MNIVGLGQAGCKIAKELENYSQYKQYYIDVKNEGYDNFHPIKEQFFHQDYEKNYKKLNLKNCKGETTVILSGVGNISGCVLRLLEQLKNNPLNVLYVKADESPILDGQAVKDKIVSQVLQQYARSGKIQRIYMFSNKNTEEIVGDLSIKNYWNQINNAIASTFHMYNIFNNTEPLLKNLAVTPPPARISTFGVVNYKTGSEKLFYDIQYARAKSYFYNLNSDTLEGEKDTLNKIRSFTKQKSEQKVSTGFSIYPTDYKDNYVYSKHDASFIQEQDVK